MREQADDDDDDEEEDEDEDEEGKQPMLAAAQRSKQVAVRRSIAVVGSVGSSCTHHRERNEGRKISWKEFFLSVLGVLYTIMCIVYVYVYV